MGAWLACDEGLAELWLDNAGKRNALDLATWHTIPRLIGEAVARSETRVVVVRGAGGHFAAGADISEFDSVFADPAATLDYLDAMSAATAAIEAAPVPVVARIEGSCIGAGVAVALACDLRLAAANARFAVTPAKLGLVYSLADTRRLVAAVGPSAAKDLLFTARTIDAAEAAKLGLIDAAHDGAGLDAAMAAKVRSIVETSACTHARTKATVGRLAAGATQDDAETRGWFAHAPAGAHYREGLAAFRERRPPSFGAG